MSPIPGAATDLVFDSSGPSPGPPVAGGEQLAGGSTRGSALLSLYATSAITMALLVKSPEYRQWFVLPVFACGVVIGVDAFDWFRGRLGLFDPVGVMGVFGYYFFFLAPLLHVGWDFWMRYVVAPPDWRPWLGWFAVINFAGLCLYRLLRRTPREPSPPLGDGRATWQVNPRSFLMVGILALIITGGLQVVVLVSVGGVSGYIQTYAESTNAFQGLGWLFLVSESFPAIALILYAVLGRGRRWACSPVTLSVVAVAFFALKIVFGGLRGSRSNTVFDLVWMAGIVHYWLRPLSKKLLAVGAIFLTVFMYLYGFYKEKDLITNGTLRDPTTRAQVENTRGRSVQGVLLQDLGRSDVQAFVLYRLKSGVGEYHYAGGRTYVGDALSFVPKALWADRPPSKTKEGTEALYGLGSYDSGGIASTRQYGLAGEALLNFGPWVAPLSFIALALLVTRVHRLFSRVGAVDSRLLILPVLVALGPVLVAEDFDNVIFYVLQHVAVPLLVVVVGSKRVVHAKAIDTAEP